jgi:hypothetical protein
MNNLLRKKAGSFRQRTHANCQVAPRIDQWSKPRDRSGCIDNSQFSWRRLRAATCPVIGWLPTYGHFNFSFMRWPVSQLLSLLALTRLNQDGKKTAHGFSDIMIGGAILPSLLHQDPRYFYQGTGTTRSRLLHAMSNPFASKGDNGRLQPNYSTIGGDLAASALVMRLILIRRARYQLSPSRRRQSMI